MSALKNILSIGINSIPTVGPESVRTAAPSAEALKAKIAASLEAIKAAGYNPTIRQYSQEEMLAGTPLAEMEELLKSQAWDGYFIGFGIRGVPEFTPVFETLVNLGRQHAPNTPMGFNTNPSPQDMIETFKRAF